MNEVRFFKDLENYLISYPEEKIANILRIKDVNINIGIDYGLKFTLPLLSKYINSYEVRAFLNPKELYIYIGILLREKDCLYWLRNDSKFRTIKKNKKFFVISIITSTNDDNKLSKALYTIIYKRGLYGNECFNFLLEDIFKYIAKIL